MQLIMRATNANYRRVITDAANEGRLPMARFTFGYIKGLGWGFLHPWEQQAIFPGKGTLSGIGDPLREHEPFFILRVSSLLAAFKHANQDYIIEGYYWHGWVWRKSWGKRWGFWPRFRYALLDPDPVTHDPGKAEDWGVKEGEDW